MRAHCQHCRTRLAQRGLFLCTICRSEGEALLRGFQPRDDSIESTADSWAVGMASAGIACALLAAFATFVKSGLVNVWWPI